MHTIIRIFFVTVAMIAATGAYRVHFEDLCARCDESLEIVMKALEIRETN